MNRVHYTRNHGHLAALWLPRRQLWVVLSAIALVTSSRVDAAPVTLHFSATIETVPPGIPFDAGIHFALGDTISGDFTFEPTQGDGGQSYRAVQPYDFILNINGVSVFTPSFTIEAIDNVLVVSDCPPGVNCLSGVFDELIVGGSFLAGVENQPALGIAADRSSFRMELYGLPHLLSQGSIPSDDEAWNAFQVETSLGVSFENGVGGVVGFQAKLSNFTTIPEPSCATVAVLASASLLCCRRRAY